jgi:hypothetical protein
MFQGVVLVEELARAGVPVIWRYWQILFDPQSPFDPLTPLIEVNPEPTD